MKGREKAFVALMKKVCLGVAGEYGVGSGGVMGCVGGSGSLSPANKVGTKGVILYKCPRFSKHRGEARQDTGQAMQMAELRVCVLRHLRAACVVG